MDDHGCTASPAPLDARRNDQHGFSIERLPKALQASMRALYHTPASDVRNVLATDQIHHGDCLKLLPRIAPNSVALSVWSPPYFVGKEYEAHLSYETWEQLIQNAIALHFAALKPGGFLAVNIADILCFKDEEMPRLQADLVSRKRVAVTREMILEALGQAPGLNRYTLAKMFNCSEQTIDRRLNGNNIRGGKTDVQTRVKVVGGLIEKWALAAGLYPYDRRVWVKDAAWENSRWTSLSYRAVDEFEYVYIFWKPGVTRFDRNRLKAKEWTEWGSRAVWSFPSVRANNDHEAKFPLELPRRCIQLLTDPNDIVLDCFMGSGTTAVAAQQLGRSFIGIEKDRRYVELAREQLGQKPKKDALRPRHPAHKHNNR